MGHLEINGYQAYPGHFFRGGNIDQEECENTDGYWSEYGYDGCGECVGDSAYDLMLAKNISLILKQ